jgi:hypothetical protein
MPKGSILPYYQNTFAVGFGGSDIPEHRCSGISKGIELSAKVIDNEVTDRN